ncbi:MAG TPA: flagellar export chaperone FliS [Phycisphaerales bacterium]|nr:flagellar export chaperone FliS [Phycisphaerales bacterium]HCD31029.1 flagellar export chaperone FliS [Phycisphaerales bacterium]|tara:strand:+ start:1867 stop:2364 length:498 start_codon:yes stop_codon:yes gene_type:complete
MSNAAANPYLRTKIMTASSEELRLMLYEGAIKFTRQAMTCLESKDFEGSYTALMRSQKIVLELSTSLNFDIAPELCDKLSALYTYIYRLLVEANMQREVKPASEALELLEYEKETWIMLMQSIGNGSEADIPVTKPRPQSPYASGLSTPAPQPATGSYSGFSANG